MLFGRAFFIFSCYILCTRLNVFQTHFPSMQLKYLPFHEFNDLGQSRLRVGILANREIFIHLDIPLVIFIPTELLNLKNKM